MVDVNKTLEILLKEYPSMLKMLRSAEYEAPNVLRGNLRSSGFSYSSDGSAPSTDSPVNHFTALELVLSNNQMSYVLFACMAQDGRFDGVRPFSLDETNKKKFNYQVARDYSMKFKKPFKSTDEFHGRVAIVNHRVTKTPTGLFIVTHHEFDFMDGSAYGECRAATTIQENELTQK